jgi:ribosomal protein L40E
MNNLEVCKKCGDVVKNNITEPDRVVIVTKTICKKCNNNNNVKPLKENLPIDNELSDAELSKIIQY